jgi:hypothetical protein
MPELHDQHDQQTDARDVQRPEHQGPDDDPASADRPAVKKSDQLQFHRPQTRTRRAGCKRIPDKDDPANHDSRADDRDRHLERACHGREKEQEGDADDDGNRHIDEKRHEPPAERAYLHPRRQACLAVGATLRGRFHDKLLVVRDWFAGETLLRKVNQYRHSVTELHDGAHWHRDWLARSELLTIATPGWYQDRSVRGIQIRNNNLPVVWNHLQMRPADVVVRTRDGHQPGRPAARSIA